MAITTERVAELRQLGDETTPYAAVSALDALPELLDEIERQRRRKAGPWSPVVPEEEA